MSNTIRVYVGDASIPVPLPGRIPATYSFFVVVPGRNPHSLPVESINLFVVFRYLIHEGVISVMKNRIVIDYSSMEEPVSFPIPEWILARPEDFRMDEILRFLAEKLHVC